MSAPFPVPRFWHLLSAGNVLVTFVSFISVCIADEYDIMDEFGSHWHILLTPESGKCCPQYSPMWQLCLLWVLLSVVTLTRRGVWRLMDSVAIIQPLVSHIHYTPKIWATSECTQIVSKYVGWADTARSFFSCLTRPLDLYELTRVSQICVVPNWWLFLTHRQFLPPLAPKQTSLKSLISICFRFSRLIFPGD